MLTRFFFSLATIALVSLALPGCRKSSSPNSSANRASVSVSAATAEQRDFPLWLTGIGTVQASNTVTVRPRVGGELKSLHFTEGQLVRAGDLLAQIDPRPYRAALEQALAQQAQDEARLANARREFQRARDLVANNTESRQLLEQREAALAEATAQLQASQAAVANAQLQLDFTTIRAPIDGRTGIRLVDAGNLVTASQTTGLVVLTQTRPIQAVFTLPQQHVTALRRALANAHADNSTPAQSLAVEVFSERNERLARGTLALVDNQIDSATGTLRLKATFPNDDDALWPGLFITARVLVETLPDALVIPTEAVQPGLNGPFVYVIQADSTVAPRNLQLGPASEGLTVVTSGLQPGERIVRLGQNKLQPGARVEIKSSANTTNAPAVASSTQPAAPAR